MPALSLVLHTGAQVPLPEGAVSIASLTPDMVEFSVTQFWNSGNVSLIAIRHLTSNGSVDCSKNINIQQSQSVTMTGVCTQGHSDFAVFVYLGSDTTLNPSENICDADVQGSSDIAAYYFGVNCRPHICASASPSTAPSTPPGPLDYCTADVELLAQVGVTNYTAPPIHIISQDHTSVTFGIAQEWVASSLSHLYAQYHLSGTGDTECFDNQDFTKNQTLTYTAHCMHNVPITIVDIWVSDSSLTSGDNAMVPTCCHPPTGVTTPTVEYTFELKCLSACAPTSAPGHSD